MQAGFFYDFSNYGTHDRLTEDGLTQWHPAFLSLGKSLEECAAKYRGFCKRYRPQPKQEKSYHWGSKLLPKVIKGKKKKISPGQLRLPWAEWEPLTTEVQEVAEKFVMANCYDPQIAAQLF
jgi:putative transposase